MRIRKKKWAQGELDVCPYYIKNPEEHAGKWRNLFCSPTNDLELEIGCGKGTFIAEKAFGNRDINYIGLDIKSDMLGVARRTISGKFKDEDPKNVLLVPYNVEFIDKLFLKSDNIKTLYINFCNPWPRLKHNKRRLTFPNKLDKYYDFLSDNAKVYFKTDDDGLFDDSLEYFEESRFRITYITRDLHKSDIKDNIVTEHEKMFTDEGKKIKYLIATK